MRAVAPPNPQMDTTFMNRAACKGKGALVFPVSGGPGTAAKQVCDDCPVRRECGAYADAAGAEGFWAGRWRRGPA